MVKTRLCTRCAGLGKIMTAEEPPDDVTREDAWKTCTRCKGSGVEMAEGGFEVYFVFDHEVEARAFMDSASGSFRSHGLRQATVRKDL